MHHSINTWRLAFLLAIFSSIWCAEGFTQGPDPSDSPYSLSGFSESQARQIEDNVPLDVENGLLLKLLYLTKKVSPQSMAAYGEFSQDLGIKNLVESPQEHRLWVFRIKGSANSVKQIPLRDADDLSNRCYMVKLKTKDGDCNVLTHDVPKAWFKQKALDQPCEFRGFFFQLQHSDDEPSPLFVANRINWFPDDVDKALAIDESQLILSKNGVDLGLFDFVRARNTKRLSLDDAECFYQMLSASKKIESIPADLTRSGFVELMKNPTKHFGDAVRLTGRIRRCIPIEIDSPDIRTRLGLQRYYHLDMLIGLDNEKIVIKNAGSENLVYANRFPVTVCVARLPEGALPADIENTTVEIEGFFFRFWRYSNEFTDTHGSTKGQVSPLVIGLVPKSFSRPANTIDLILTAAILLMLSGVGLMIWMYRRKPDERPIITRRGELPDKLDIGSLPSEID